MRISRPAGTDASRQDAQRSGFVVLTDKLQVKRLEFLEISGDNASNGELAALLVSIPSENWQARSKVALMVKHTGGCHCGRVRFELIAPARIQVSDCNCSICSKAGYLHLIVPAERFKLLSGGDALISYTFNTNTAKHLFCSTCGIKSFYVPRSHPDGFSVNARCLDPGTVEEVCVTATNGREWEKHYPAGRGEYS